MLKEILTQLGTTAVVVAITGFIFKTWISHHLTKLLIKSEQQFAIQIENVRAEWAKEVAKLNVHESHLHNKRVELIEALYSKMLSAEFSLQNFLLSWWAHSNKDGKIKEYVQGRNIEFSMSRGIEFCEKFSEINATLHQNALYFDETFIEKIKKSYKPFVETIMQFDENNIPDLPEQYKDIVNAGQEPRSSVINLFREHLGVIKKA